MKSRTNENKMMTPKNNRLRSDGLQRGRERERAAIPAAFTTMLRVATTMNTRSRIRVKISLPNNKNTS